MALNTSERNLRWRTRFPEKHKANFDNWRVGNKEKRNEYARKWHAKTRAENPAKYREKTRRHILKRKYGITPEDYDRMLAEQGGHCALCSKTESDEKHGRLNIDHCHTTGKVRGLLCTPHNRALGTLGDNEEGIARALKYIQGI